MPYAELGGNHDFGRKPCKQASRASSQTAMVKEELQFGAGAQLVLILPSRSAVSNSVFMHINSSSTADLSFPPCHTPRLSWGQNQLCERLEVRLCNSRGGKPDAVHLRVPLVAVAMQRRP